MDRRKFIKQSAKLAGTALVASQVPSCTKFEDFFYPTLSNGINWGNFQLSVNIGSQGAYDTTQASQPTIINEYGVGKMWYVGNDGTNDRIIYAESK